MLSKILSSHFRTYLSSIEKMQSVVAGQFDVLGAPEGTAGSVGSMMTSIFSKQQGKPTTVCDMCVGQSSGSHVAVIAPSHAGMHAGGAMLCSVWAFLRLHAIVMGGSAVSSQMRSQAVHM